MLYEIRKYFILPFFLFIKPKKNLFVFQKTAKLINKQLQEKIFLYKSCIHKGNLPSYLFQLSMTTRYKIQVLVALN